jgi:hypothetical protein
MNDAPSKGLGIDSRARRLKDTQKKQGVRANALLPAWDIGLSLVRNIAPKSADIYLWI